MKHAVDRREKSVEQSTNAISNPSARSENTFFVNYPVAEGTVFMKHAYQNKLYNEFFPYILLYLNGKVGK